MNKNACEKEQRGGNEKEGDKTLGVGGLGNEKEEE